MILDGINVRRQYDPEGGLPGLTVQGGRGKPKRWFDEYWQARMEFVDALRERGWTA